MRGLRLVQRCDILLLVTKFMHADWMYLESIFDATHCRYGALGLMSSCRTDRQTATFFWLRVASCLCVPEAQVHSLTHKPLERYQRFPCPASPFLRPVCGLAYPAWSSGTGAQSLLFFTAGCTRPTIPAVPVPVNSWTCACCPGYW